MGLLFLRHELVISPVSIPSVVFAHCIGQDGPDLCMYQSDQVRRISPNLPKSEIFRNYPVGLEYMSKQTKTQLTKAAKRLTTSFKRNSQRKETGYGSAGRVVYDEFGQKPCKPIVDKIVQILAKHYGLTEEEQDFIVNYDTKYRMRRGK